MGRCGAGGKVEVGDGMSRGQPGQEWCWGAWRVGYGVEEGGGIRVQGYNASEGALFSRPY
jgi:hypothetical protein